MHLYIEQNTGLTENVSSSVVKKLYELAVGGTLDNTSDLKGTLHTTIAAASHKAYLEGMFSDFHIDADEYSLSFEDPEVERICVTNWGSNGAVTLNQLQSLNTTSVNNTPAFKNNTTITKFNEFQYFTGITGTFNNNTNSIFSGCTNLEEITLPSTLANMNPGMFLNCTSLTSIIIPASVQSMTYVFAGCTGLTTVTFAPNSNLTTVSGGCFQGCSSLTTIINYPSTCTTIGQQMFAGCLNLQTMIPLPTGITEIPSQCYYQCRSMSGEFVIPATVTTIKEYAFRETNSFTGIKIYATTPPTLDVIQLGSVFSNASSNNNPAVGYPIYVPQSALADYQADAKWSQFGSRLQGFTP